jgi:hypothetical protein
VIFLFFVSVEAHAFDNRLMVHRSEYLIEAFAWAILVYLPAAQSLKRRHIRQTNPYFRRIALLVFLIAFVAAFAAQGPKSDSKALRLARFYRNVFHDRRLSSQYCFSHQVQ